MSEKLRCADAVERLGYYAADMFGEFRAQCEENDKVREQLLCIDKLHGFDVGEVNINTLLKLNYVLSSLDAFIELSAEVLRVAQKYSEEAVGPEHKSYDDIEDAAFLLVETALTMRAVGELMQELDPLQEYAADYIRIFAQGL